LAALMKCLFQKCHSRRPQGAGSCVNALPKRLKESQKRQVAIQVGSIHSVKGKTHTATLVLEMFWQDRNGRHNLQLLSPWLRAEQTGGLGAGAQQQSRLKLHYVAMGRPTHLLCLAMKRSTFAKADGSLDEELVRKLKDHGWCEIKCV